MLKALIFDVDGTLADTERDGHRVAFNRAFADAGLDWHWNEQRYGDLLQVAGGRERILHFIGSDAPHIAAATRDALARRLHSDKTGHYVRLVEAGAVRLRPGIARLLAEAHAARLRLAIATTTSRANIEALLARALPAGARKWFAVIAGADEAPRKKPDPQVYHVALDQLGIGAHECFAFEDSAAGLRAARGAGIPTVVTVNDYTVGQNFTGALSVLSDFGEPGRPATVLAGARLQRGLLDVQQLRDWHVRFVR